MLFSLDCWWRFAVGWLCDGSALGVVVFHAVLILVPLVSDAGFLSVAVSHSLLGMLLALRFVLDLMGLRCHQGESEHYSVHGVSPRLPAVVLVSAVVGWVDRWQAICLLQTQCQASIIIGPWLV
jgi:hypothetical protein